jgi:hypothetical protein
MTSKTSSAQSSLLALVLCAAACGDSAEVIETPGGTGGSGSADNGGASGDPTGADGGTAGDPSASNGGGGSAAGAGGGASGEEPLYLVVTQIDAGSDMRQSYLNLTPSLDGSTTLDATSGVEKGYTLPVVFGGAVLVPDPLGPTLTRYTVSESGTLVAGARLSFADLGVTFVSGESIHVVSAQKAYLFDTTGLRAIVFDPTEMVRTGAQIDLAPLAREGFRPFTFLEDFNKKVRGSRLFAPVTWFDDEFASRYGAAVMVIDTDNDTLVSVLEDTRCGDAWVSVAMPAGELYFFPNAANVEEHVLTAETPGPSCALRINPGEEVFDPSFTLNLGELAGAPAQGAAPDGSNGFFFAVVDAARYADRENNDYTFWTMWHYDGAAATAAPVPDFPFWTGAIRYYEIDGRVILPQFESLPAWRTTFLELAPDPEAPPFAVDASWTTVARVR